MIKRRNILTALATAIIAAAVSGCSHDSFSDVPEEPLAVPQLHISIAMNGPARSATDGFEVGEGLENYLDITNILRYRIYFFSSDNTYIDTFTPLSSNIEDGDVTENVRYYHFWGAAPAGLPLSFKIVALFNWPVYPDETTSSGSFVLQKGVTTIAELCSGAYAQFPALTSPGGEGTWLDNDELRLIPFYGVREYDLRDYVDDGDINGKGEIREGVRIDLSKKKGGDKAATLLPVLRAMAKVEVILDDPDLNFERVEIVNVNPKGYCAPKNATTHDSYDHGYDWDRDFIREVHLPWKDGSDKDVNASAGEVIGSLLMTRKSTTQKKWIAYIPEYLNNNVAKGTDCRIKVTLSQGSVSNDEWGKVEAEKKSQYIYFTPDGKQGSAMVYDIWRNNIYRFIISSMNFRMDVVADIQPFAEQRLNFGFGLVRDSRGDLMVVPTPMRDEAGNVVLDENGEVRYVYPQYFSDFIADDNPNHKFPQEEDEAGNVKPGSRIRLEDGDYYAIVVGEYESMSDAELWVKDRTGCHVLSNFGKVDDGEDCNARLVEAFFGNNQSEKFYKDKWGYRRVHHFENHNTIVIDPEDDGMMFCIIDNFGTASQTRKYYEVESWDENSGTGWIINKDDAGNETGFQEIRSDGTLGYAVDLEGNRIS